VLVVETDRERLLRHEEILPALAYDPVGFTKLPEAALAHAEQARFDVALVCHNLALLPPSISRRRCMILHPTCRSGSTFNAGFGTLRCSQLREFLKLSILTSAELAGAFLRCLRPSVAPQLQSQSRIKFCKKWTLTLVR
jgi:hypothetical protein